MIMLNLILFFLFASLLLYVILGGADFGAGILELFTRRKNTQAVRNLTYKAIGPVWEANHIWLILIIVILFVAFPEVYRTLSIHLHLPIMFLLVGIILRGSAFVFRHYDAIKDDTQKIYTRAFISASFLTPLFLGITAGATILGKIDPAATDFYAGYIAPWLNLFSFSVGLFFTAICAFLAAVFLVGETTEPGLRKLFYRQAVGANLAAVLTGILVFVSAGFTEFSLVNRFLASPLALTSIVIASLLVPLVWRAVRQENVFWSRLFAGALVALILLGWIGMQFPDIIRMKTGNLSIAAVQAPPQVLETMGYALIGGSLLIFPSLYFLFRVFKFQPDG